MPLVVTGVSIFKQEDTTSFWLLLRGKPAIGAFANKNLGSPAQRFLGQIIRLLNRLFVYGHENRFG